MVRPRVNQWDGNGSGYYIRAIKRPAPKQPRAKAVKAVCAYIDPKLGRVFTTNDVDHKNMKKIISWMSSERDKRPVAIIQISNPDALVEQVATALMGAWNTPLTDAESLTAYRHYARVALSSLGLIPARKSN